ncbi:MAG TPA: FAD/NAD(P)-binding oxidoreductase, partial [Anaerolineaceae bacterium]|nr:FAD/NAD(P)-binding oxidoreductase [Anaerolineaceae bacterium]
IIQIKLPDMGFQPHYETKVTTIDPANHQVHDQAGNTYGYLRLLLATGGRPRRLPFGGDAILYYRTLEDYHTVRGWTGKGARFGIIGGGFIGSELAAALAINDELVSMVIPEAGIGSWVFPADLASFLNQYYTAKGVDVRAGEEIVDVVTLDAGKQSGPRYALKTKSGQSIEVDHVIAGIGIQPNTEIAHSAGIELAEPKDGGGILVDEYLRTNLPDIFAAGDNATFYNPALGKRVRVEHEDNANTMGYFAGLNLAGQDTPYYHQPYFYSDLFDLAYEALGDTDPRLDHFADWEKPYQKGVVYYLNEGRVRGVLLWNTWGQVDAARRLIAENRRVEKTSLKGRLPEK